MAFFWQNGRICIYFFGFATFGCVFGQFLKMANFALYFTKGGQKKVRHHLERAHIDSKMCSGLLGATRTRIQPVLKPLRHFAHFVTRYSPSPYNIDFWNRQDVCFHPGYVLNPPASTCTHLCPSAPPSSNLRSGGFP